VEFVLTPLFTARRETLSTDTPQKLLVAGIAKKNQGSLPAGVDARRYTIFWATMFTMLACEY
jgi:hypothetical protein